MVGLLEIETNSLPAPSSTLAIKKKNATILENVETELTELFETE